MEDNQNVYMNLPVSFYYISTLGRGRLKNIVTF
jgi:hypothetical protein